MSGLTVFENPIDQLRGAQREDRVDMVPQAPMLQGAVRPAPPAGETVAESVQESIEIGVLDDKHLVLGVVGIVIGQMAGQL